ncbi:MAG: HAMP domain-containing sensor histidine kinase [Oceanospirillaceae bacterium]
MYYFRYFRRQVTLTFIIFSAFLSGLFSFLIWTTIESTDDQVREDLLQAQSQKLVANFEKTGSLSKIDELFGIQVLLENRDEIPAKWLALPTGIYEDNEEDTHLEKILLQIDNETRQVFLVHVPANGDVLDNNRFPVQLILTLISLVVTLIGSLVGILLARNLSRPVRELSIRIADTDPNQPVFEPLDRNDEFGEISDAFARTLLKINQVIEREKQFSAYVSHELRTPVAVIKSSLELAKVCREKHDTKASKHIEEQALSRMSIANTQMELLIETFLYLGTKNSLPAMTSNVDIAAILREKIEAYNKEYQIKGINITLDILQALPIACNEKMLELILENILRNTFSYCAGSISIVLKTDKLYIYNDIDQLRIDTAEHFGFGLQIVEDLCKSHSWSFSSGIGEQNQYLSTINFHRASY